MALMASNLDKRGITLSVLSQKRGNKFLYVHRMNFLDLPLIPFPRVYVKRFLDATNGLRSGVYLYIVCHLCMHVTYQTPLKYQMYFLRKYRGYYITPWAVFGTCTLSSGV